MLEQEQTRLALTIIIDLDCVSIYSQIVFPFKVFHWVLSQFFSIFFVRFYKICSSIIIITAKINVKWYKKTIQFNNIIHEGDQCEWLTNRAFSALIMRVKAKYLKSAQTLGIGVKCGVMISNSNLDS